MLSLSIPKMDEKILAFLTDTSQQEEGFRLLVDTYGDRLFQHVRRMLNSEEDADDVLQNTMVKVYRNISKFKGNSQLYTWLYRIATNEALSHLDRQKRRNRVFMYGDNDVDLAMKQQKASLELDGDFIKQRLKEAMDALPPKQKAVFSLRYFEETSYQEMSDIMGTSVGALKASYHHAVRKIELFLKA